MSARPKATSRPAETVSEAGVYVHFEADFARKSRPKPRNKPRKKTPKAIKRS